jgi:DNA transposition AAA+ family ATPase
MTENNKYSFRGDEELRDWLASYVAKYPHHTTAVLSRSEFIGVSRAALEAYLQGTYFLPTNLGGQGADPEKSTIEESIRAYRLRSEGTERHDYAGAFIETRTYRQVKQACSIAVNENKIVVVHGSSGIGKSKCLAEYAKREMTTAPIIILCSGNINWHYFVEMIASRMGLDRGMKTVKLEDVIALKLQRTPRTLFVDQANYLDERGLATICHIWEKARIPVGLFGTKDLFNLFMSSRQTEDVRAQLASRVGYHFLLSELSLSEAKSIITEVLQTDASDAAIAQIYNITRGLYRYMNGILPSIINLKELNKEKLARGETTMKEIIATAGSRLIMGE